MYVDNINHHGQHAVQTEHTRTTHNNMAIVPRYKMQVCNCDCTRLALAPSTEHRASSIGHQA